MQRPNYFLADLPPEAAVTPDILREALLTLRRNRVRYLAPLPTSRMIEVLCDLAAEWLRPDYPYRQWALKDGPGETGFSSAVLAHGIDTFFAQFTVDRIEALLLQDLGHLERLDRPVTSSAEEHQHRASMAIAPELLVHVAAGNIPCGIWMSMLLGLLLRSAQFIKCARGQAFLPRVLAHSLYEVEPKLASCLELAVWPGGTDSLETELFREADCVTASGNDETIQAVRQRVRGRFVGYGHRLSFAFVSKTVRTRDGERLIAGVARDVTAWDQLGCLSPHVIFVEAGGPMSAEEFAAALATELSRVNETFPRGRLETSEHSTIAARRDFYEVRASFSGATRLWQSEGSTDWTLVYEADALFQASCLNRFIYVKPVSHLTHALEQSDAIRGRVSTVGLGATDTAAPELVMQLARWGVTRVCPLGQMQAPPLPWRHDGRPALGDLVSWTDWERR